MKTIVKSKKIVALAIALVMLVGFIPTGLLVFGQAADWAGSAATTTYAFPRVDAVSKAPDLRAFDALNKVFTDGTKINHSTTNSGNPNWYSKGDYVTYNNYLAVDTWNRLLYRAETRNQFFTLQIILPQTPGKYAVKVKTEVPYGTNKYDTFIFDKDATVTKESLVTTSANYIGSGTKGVDQTWRIGTFEVTKEMAGKEVKFAMIASADSSGTNGTNVGLYGSYLYSIIFDGSAPPSLASIEVTANKTDLNPVDNTAELSVSGKMTDNATANITTQDISYKNLTPDFITLDGNQVTYKAEGTGKVEASVTLDGVTKTDTIEFNCVNRVLVDTNDWAGVNASVTYDFRYGFEDGTAAAKGTKPSAFANYNAKTNPNWKYNGQHWYDANNTCTFDGWMRLSMGRPDFRNAATFTIKLPTEPGKYSVEFTHRNYYTAPQVDLYICDANATALYEVNNRKAGQHFSGVMVDNVGKADENTTIKLGEYIVKAKDAGKEKVLVITSEVLNTDSEEMANGGIGSQGMFFRSVTFNGANPEALSEITLSSSSDTIEKGDSASISVAGKLANGNIADLSAATIEYTSKTPETAEVSDTGVVTALDKGLVTIEVKVTLGKVTLKKTIDLTAIHTLPYAGKVNNTKYDFVAGLYDERTDLLTEYNEAKNANWKFHSMNGAISCEGFYGLAMRFNSNTKSENTYIAFTVKAPKQGRYTGYFKWANHVGALQMKIYALPANTPKEQIAAKAKESVPLGIVNYDGVVGDTIKLGQIDMYNEDAEMLLVFIPTKYNVDSAGTGYAGMSLTNLELIGEAPSPLDQVNLIVSSDTISKNAPATTIVTATLEDGEAADLSAKNLAEIKLQSSDESVLKVETDGTLVAVSDGKAILTATVTLNGVTKSASRDIVCVSYGGESTSNEINLMTGLADDGENLDLLTDYNAGKNARWTYFGNYMNLAGRSTTRAGAVNFIGMDDGAWSAIKFKSGNEGAYQFKLAYKNHIGAKNGKIFVFAGDTKLSNIDALVKSSNPVGTFAYAEGENIATLGEVALRKDTEYVLVLQADGVGDDATHGYATLTATKLIFDGNEPAPVIPQLDSISLNVVKALAIGGAATATVAGTMDDGNDADLTGATVAYSSSNTDAVTIDKTTGAMLGIAGGETIITATVTLGTVTKTDSKTVTVLTEQENPIQPGIEHSVTYDFVSCLARSGEMVAPLTDYNPNKNTNWAYVTHSSNYTNWVASFYGALQILNEKAGQYVAFKIKAPEPGLYAGTMAYSGSANAKKAEVYILPGNITPDKIEETMATTPAAAIYDVVSSALGDLQYVSLGNLNLTGQTDYYFIIKCSEVDPAPASGKAGTLYLNTLHLSGAKPLDSLTSKLDNGKTNNVLSLGTSCGILNSTPSVPSEAAQATYTYSSSNEEVATVTADGTVTAHSNGFATITVNATLQSISKSTTFDVIAGTLKARRTRTSDETLEIMKENFDKYDWAAPTLKNAVKAADLYVDRYEEICDLLTSNELPRGAQMYGDPNFNYCYYCETDLGAVSGGFITDPLDVAWKVQCSECRRYFPSNDFGSYYKLGLDEHGLWSEALSKQKNDEIIANGGDGYLKNVLYPEKNTEEEPNWGVDNGFGYDSGKYLPAPNDRVKIVHCYIPRYNHALWGSAWNYNSGGPINRALFSLSEAYKYTGEEKYGIAGAVILDRVADIYPTMHLNPAWRYVYVSSSGGSGKGTVLGCIADYNLAVRLADSYDALWPAMENPKVIQILSEKAKKYNLENPKTSADLIRFNSDNGLLRAIRQGIHTTEIWGNFGYPQHVMATIGVVLDTMPESKEWIDWIFESSKNSNGAGIVGEKGNVNSSLVTNVDRDGWGNEAAPGYNLGWINSMGNIASVLNGYKDTYAGADIYNHPKYRRMIFATTELTMASRYTPNIGDTGYFAKPDNIANLGLFTSAWGAGIRDDNIARMIYLLCDGDLSGLSYGAASRDPFAIQSEVQAVIDEKGQGLDLESTNLGGFGLMTTRDGEWKVANNGIDTQRSYWMYYGRNGGHGHAGHLNLGLVAYGINMAPDLGNPDYKSVDCNRITWSSTPMAHNTVMVIEKKGETYTEATENGVISGDPYHFDDSDKVKVMDVDVPELYDSTEIFRRTVVEVDYNDDVSYAVDFFRVKGGNDHVYNFHAQGDEIEVDIPMSAQVDENGDFVGSYAGPEIPYGPDEMWENDWHTKLKSPVGFTWLKNIYRANNPTAATISADFKIRDFFNVLPGNPNLHMKLTMLNTDNEITEFAYGDTRPPKSTNSPALIKQIMARRQGKNLDSLYTTVIQPYKDNPYIEKVEEVPVVIKSGYEGKNDAARAVKVTLTTGRVDYIVYATNNTVTYTVDNKFDMRAFVGVVTYEPDVEAPIYTYMNDGTFLAGMTGTDKYTGKVVDFTRELSLDNSITVEFDGSFDVNKLVGQYIYIDNGSRSNSQANSTYKIEGAEVSESDPTIVKLDVGMTTTTLSYVDETDETKGFNYLMGEGMDFEIPLPTFEDASPIPNELPKQRVEAGNTLTFKVTATSQTGNELTYKMNDSVEGMIFDEQTQTFTWSPTTADRGDNIASFIVSDGLLETQFYVEIEVANPTGGSVAGGDTFPDDTPAGGGGGGGGGSDDPKPDDPTDDPNTDEPGTDEPGTTPGGNSGKKFVDLGAHSWAEEAIYELVDAGVINGTSANTYSPAKNITRADFATLAVRLFKFEGEAETFTDVPSDKYYAEPVGIAKANGIVNGISETEFAPMKEISREDMMVMLYRALKAAGIELPETVELTHLDFDEVSDYAKEAVSALIKSGLIAGSNGKINPKATAARAEVAVVLSRIYALISK